MSSQVWVVERVSSLVVTALALDGLMEDVEEKREDVMSPSKVCRGLPCLSLPMCRADDDDVVDGGKSLPFGGGGRRAKALVVRMEGDRSAIENADAVDTASAVTAHGEMFVMSDC